MSLFFAAIMMLWPGLCFGVWAVFTGRSFLLEPMAFLYLVVSPAIAFALYNLWLNRPQKRRPE